MWRVAVGRCFVSDRRGRVSVVYGYLGIFVGGVGGRWWGVGSPLWEMLGGSGIVEGCEGYPAEYDVSLGGGGVFVL